LYLHARTELFDRPTRLLHLAPEPCLAERLCAAETVDYLSGDLTPGAGMVTLDLTALDLPDSSFDAALCLHVLEHVADDRAAMKELHRVLRPGGWCLVEVPLRGEETHEAWPGISAQERELHFYQADHERLYGRSDLAARLEAAGFEVEVEIYRDELAPEARRRYRLALDLGPDVEASDEPWITFRCSR
ncbi:MAG: methyltransferase domain-containing protein, partial [Chloroflexota bacterium]|nr:methyltransferase domain-containing protein [Chloroflexota bacterium]